MKNFTPVFLFLYCLGIANAFAAEIKYDDFKKLTDEERRQLIQHADPLTQEQYKQWSYLVEMKGQWWTPSQAFSFIQEKKLDGISDLVSEQITIWGYFEIATNQANKASGMSLKDQDAAVDAIEAKIAILNKENYLDRWWYLVRLAPTPEALALNEKAKKLWDDLHARYGTGNVSKADLAAMDAAVDAIRKEMRKLPQLNQKEIEEGIGASSFAKIRD